MGQLRNSSASRHLGLRVLIWLAGATTVLWLPLMFVAPMAFDAPGAPDRIGPYLVVAACLLLIAAPGTCQHFASAALKRGRVGQAFIFAMLPFLMLAIGAFLIFAR